MKATSWPSEPGLQRALARAGIPQGLVPHAPRRPMADQGPCPAAVTVGSMRRSASDPVVSYLPLL
jgi:hypothetical protein